MCSALATVGRPVPGRRCLGSAAAAAAKPGGFFELRTDHVRPACIDKFVIGHDCFGAQKAKLFPGWLGSWQTDMGGEVHTVQHLFRWSDYDERDRVMSEVKRREAWYSADFVPGLRHGLAATTSAAMLEATDVLHACGLPGAGGFSVAHGALPTPSGSSPPLVAWELRRYQLVLGYTTVPRFLDLYREGLADKLAADDSGASQLASLLYSDCGDLNVVVELWRHESMQRALASRAASRGAVKWRKAIGEIAQIATSFSTQYMRPLASSPWQ